MNWDEMSARERDLLVADKIFDCKADVATVRHFTESMSTAWEAAEHTKFSISISGHSHTGYRASVGMSVAKAWTAPEAICIAALRAVGVEV